jgi:hypothetical protein
VVIGPHEFTDTELHHAITRNQLPTTDLAIRAALVSTAHVGLRDAPLSLAAGHELPADRLWTQIAAQHRGRIRAELRTMAAMAYHCDEANCRPSR